ncbi:MAG TPA: DedA family protein, partial [Longimicrobiaceae bacterium]|nr:DedA family protein [Longimicrobiaceae bacterium]
GHLALFLEPESLAGPLRDFIHRAESGAAAGRESATPSRLGAASSPVEPRRLDDSPGGFALVTVLLALATFVSEDLTCLSAGLLAAKGSLGFLTASLACLIGIFVGDMLLFYAGRWFGMAALRRAPLRWFLDASRVEQGRAFFERRTGAMIFATRFVPGTRLPTYFAAGLTGTTPGRFARYFLLAAAVWTPLLVGASMLLGQTVLRAFERYEGMALWGLVVAALLFFAGVRLLLPLLSWRGRRLLLSRWRRLTRWEFWPAWILYPPVALHILRLGIRHRSLTLFTAANPSIPCGGLVLESKAQILRGLEPSGAVAPFALIRAATGPEAREMALRDFLERS